MQTIAERVQADEAKLRAYRTVDTFTTVEARGEMSVGEARAR